LLLPWHFGVVIALAEAVELAVAVGFAVAVVILHIDRFVGALLAAPP
jgi:hypothetical protein